MACKKTAHHIFIFRQIQGTGAVDQCAPLLHVGSSTGEKIFLQRQKVIQIFFLSVPADFRLMGKDTQAGAGRVQKDFIVLPIEGGKWLGRIPGPCMDDGNSKFFALFL